MREAAEAWARGQDRAPRGGGELPAVPQGLSLLLAVLDGCGARAQHMTWLARAVLLGDGHQRGMNRQGAW